MRELISTKKRKKAPTGHKSSNLLRSKPSQESKKSLLCHLDQQAMFLLMMMKLIRCCHRPSPPPPTHTHLPPWPFLSLFFSSSLPFFDRVQNKRSHELRISFCSFCFCFLFVLLFLLSVPETTFVRETAGNLSLTCTRKFILN